MAPEMRLFSEEVLKNVAFLGPFVGVSANADAMMPDPRPDEFRPIPLGQIIEPWVVLRIVNRESVEYLELRDSLAAVGPLNSICVRPSVRRPGHYEVVDGLYRYTAACELRLSALPCIVKHNLTDDDVLALQIQANALRPETTALEYARQTRRIMDAITVRQGTDATLADVSNLIHKSPEWIGDQLRLLSLRADIQKTVERGEIPLKSAYMLAKLPMVQQAQLVELAKTVSAREFVPVAARMVKQIQEAARQGKLHDLCKDFEPVPHIRPLKEVLAEYREHRLGGLAVVKAGNQTPVDGWYLALEWALNLDEESIRAQRERFLARARANLLERRAEPCDDNE
jgi:ParB/RepB/Spo0J family partition protein